MLQSVITSDPEMEVVGLAGDGDEAIAMAHTLGPDIITMDIRMPRLDGVSAIRAIMRDRPTPIVVLCSDLNDRTLNISFNALKAGALDVIEKPRLTPGGDFNKFVADFVSTLKLMAEVKVVRLFLDESGEYAAPMGYAPAGAGMAYAVSRFDIVGICSSTGGPAALDYLLRHLPAGFPAPIAVVQHITEGFLQGLVEWLDSSSSLRVKIAEHGEIAVPGVVYFAPEHKHLIIGPGGVALYSDAEAIRCHRPSGEMLFKSMAEWFGARSMGVMLTGMGEDGIDGLADIAQRGARQNPRADHGVVRR
jgi:two-component system chemotaxis response regulator CheB